MGLEFTFEIDNNTNGTVANFTDVSTNVDYSLIKAVRLYLGNYTDDNNVAVLSGSREMDIWREYQSSTVPSFIYDNKTVGLTGRFIPFITGVSVQTGSIMSTTGRYSKYISPATYLPTVTHNVLTRVPSDFGIDDTVFPDRVYYCSYESYGDTSPLTPTTVTDGIQYIVYGTTGTATVGTNIYRIGEVFRQDGDAAVSFTGDATLKQNIAIRFKYFCFIYNIKSQLCNLFLKLSQPQFTNAEFMYQATIMKNQIESIEFANIQNLTSAGYYNNIIIDVTQKLVIIKENYPF